MRRVSVRFALTCAVLCASACDRLAVGPPRAPASAQAAAAASAPLPDFRTHAGETYADFVTKPGMERYKITTMGLSDAEQARFAHAMTNQAPGVLTSGGGSEALVFSGCAPSGCLEGLSVVAINVTTGEAFVGVSDMTGAAELSPNDRLEALLRLTSPSQTWDDPVRPQTAPG